jgi:hypothetical protein
MKRWLLPTCAAVLALTACSESENQSEASAPAVDAAAESTTADLASEEYIADPALAAPTPLAAGMPKLSYAYVLSYRAEAEGIGKLMRRHANVCEQQGPASCRIVGMNLSGELERGDIQGTLQLAVAAPHARAVTALLDDEALDAGAEQVSATIASEEVSKTIVDTEARIAAREELRDRLMEVLRTRKGSVKELVEAERSVAAVNEEIDQARSWLSETKGRVAFSRLDIDYAPRTAPASDFTAPIASALGSLGGILGTVMAGLILLLAVLLPIGGLVIGGRWINQRMRPAEHV